MKTLPARNGNLLKFLKSHHQEQLENILQKNQLEIDIVEDIRSFVKQKCSLDKTYAEGLLKLSTNFQNRKLPEGSGQYRGNNVTFLFKTKPAFSCEIKVLVFLYFWMFICEHHLVAFTSKTCPDIDCLPEVVSVSVTPAAESKSRPRDRRRISLSTEKILEGNYMCIAHSQLVVFRPCSLLKMYLFKFSKIEKNVDFEVLHK